MNEFILKYQGKELIMPEWGDFGEYVLIYPRLSLDKVGGIDGIARGLCYQHNTSHELNAKFNGLFKDCVYGEGNDIAVKVRRFDKLKVGDIFEYGSGGGKIIISYDSVRGCFNFFINGDINFCYIGLESIKDGYYKGNLLDEYLEGKNELAKMVGFD